jgi:hypothetical protein
MLSTEWIKERRPVVNGQAKESASRVKMFVHTDPRAAEAELAEWLQETSPVIEHVTQSQSEKAGRFVFVITVFYR